MTKNCSNCKNRKWKVDFGYDYCIDYEMETGNAEECDGYEYDEYEDYEYTPSATRGDYSPSCPWNAPGMSISDFI